MKRFLVGKALSIVVFALGVVPLVITLVVTHWILKALGYLDRGKAVMATKLVPAKLLNEGQRVVNPSRWQRLKCRLGFHPWITHQDHGWDMGTSIWCPVCDTQDEW